MKLLTESNPNRRELFRTIGRILALGCLTCVGAVAMKKEQPVPQQDACLIFSPCRDCQRFGNCTLPQAITAQQSVEESDDER